MQELLSIVITSSVVATIMNAFIAAWREGRSQLRSTRLDALTTAVALEGYAITCADKIADHELADSSDEQAGSLMQSVPEFPAPKVVAGFLRPKRASVAHRLSVFPQEVEQAAQAPGFWWSVVGDQDAAHNAAKQESGRVGLQSLQLARDVRRVFKLPERKLLFGEYDVEDTLMRASVNEIKG